MIKPTLSLTLVTVAAITAVGQRAPELPPSSSYLSLLPDGPEKRQFIIDCTGCHVFDAKTAFPDGAPRSRASWKERINSMYARFGAGSGFPIIADPQPSDSLAGWLASGLAGKSAPANVDVPPADPRVTEFLIPDPSDLPHDLTVQGDGSVVVTGMFSERMYMLDPRAGTFTTDNIPVPRANPRALHIDDDGTWWVLLGGPGMVAKRSPFGAWTTHSVGMYAHSVARDATGIWVNGHFTGHPSKLAHVNASTGAVTTVDLPGATKPGVSPIPYELRTAPDGKVWMSELHGGRVISYDPQTRANRVYEMPVSHSGPRRLDVAADGTVWIPLYAAGEIVELNPATGAIERHTLPVRDALPYVVRADDARGAIWIGTGASDAIYRLDRATKRIETITLPSRGALVRHLDVDKRTGDLWVAYGASPGTIAARIARVRMR